MTDRGSAALELALGIAVLVLPAVLAVVSFAPWLERREFVRAAAAEAARAAVLAVDDPAAAGSQVVAELAAGRGFDPGSVRVQMCGGPQVVAGEGSGTCLLNRDVLVTASVAIDVPVVTTPWGDVGGITVSATHREPVDAYRSLP